MMMHPLIRRIFVLLLAVFVTVGMGLSAVQASTMSMKMMDTASGMTMSGPGKCQDCGKSSDSKGMAACAAPACPSPMAAHAPSIMTLDLDFVPVRHHFQNDVVLGRDAVPDPYPPRTSDIG